MYSALKGKKLLIIGSDSGNINIINAAREMGLYTIVVDGITDRSKSPSKNKADEAWDIDYSDVEALAAKSKEAGVDGVFAGYSEFRVLAACRLAKKLGLPFYATEEQIELTRNKRTFKDECQKYGIPTPKDYCFSYPMSDEDKDKIEYPVIVKPADYAGRKGISVCNNREELDAAVEYAASKSQSSCVIVEDYLDGIEFSSLYTLSKGEISLSCVNEKYITDDQEKKTGLCDFLLSPAKSYKRYIDELDVKVRDFIRGIDAQNGVVFFQGMITAQKIYIFEMGYRLNGNNDYFTIEKFNGINYMKMMIAYSLCGDMCDDISKDNPEYKKFSCSYLLHAHGGKIGRFEYKAIYDHPAVIDVDIGAWEGKEIAEDGSTAQKVMRIKLFADTIDDIVDAIEFIQKNVTVEDVNGKNMLFKPFDARCLKKD